MNEKDPLADHSVCYYDLAKGAVVGGIEGRPAKLKARPGSVVRMTVDFDLCVVAVWIDEAQACVIHLTDDLLNKPQALYPCVLFSREKQSFSLLSAALREGSHLGDVLGGDCKLREALNRLSDMFLQRENAYRRDYEERTTVLEKAHVGMQWRRDG